MHDKKNLPQSLMKYLMNPPVSRKKVADIFQYLSLLMVSYVHIWLVYQTLAN